jgi:hypothetical protein
LAVDPVPDAAELAACDKLDAEAAARRNALAAKWGQGSIVMNAPGAPTAYFADSQGKLRSIRVTYLTGGPTA